MIPKIWRTLYQIFIKLTIKMTFQKILDVRSHKATGGACILYSNLDPQKNKIIVIICMYRNGSILISTPVSKISNHS